MRKDSYEGDLPNREPQAPRSVPLAQVERQDEPIGHARPFGTEQDFGNHIHGGCHSEDVPVSGR